PIFGGTAGDQWRFKGTRQFHGTEVLQDSVPFLLFDEGVVFSFGVDTGWRPIGREGRVTEVDGHVVRGIDGRPATEFYREFLGNADITQLTEYPLAVTADDDRGSNSYYLRAPGRTDEAAGCIHFLGDVPAAGFYGYGEIARLAKDGISHYHNETFTTLLLGGRVGSA